MKKVLVLSLVLVMALASSAFAAVNFSGKFVGEISNDGKSFKSNLEVKPQLTISIAADGGDGLNWSFEAESSLNSKLVKDKGGNITDVSSTFDLGKYKLQLNDDYFTMYFWGNDKELEDKGTTLSLISAAKKATSHRARLEVTAVEPVDVTVDFTNNALYAFVDADIADYEAGLAYKRTGKKAVIGDEKAKDTIGLWGKADVDMFTIQGDVAATLLEKDVALGYGAKVTAQVTDEAKVYAQYHGKQDGFDNAEWAKSKVSVGGSYDDGAIYADASFDYDLDKESSDTTASVAYRFSETVAFGDLFKNDKYFTNDAPAVKASVSLTDFALGTVRADVASPVVEDMVWAKAYGEYGKYSFKDETKDAVDENGDPVVDEETGETKKGLESEDTGFKVGADVYVKATDKLVLKPFASYESIGNVIAFGANADYVIGTDGPTLGLGVKKVLADDIRASERAESISASVTVEF